jgi:arylsulfatase A-like enzyme
VSRGNTGHHRLDGVLIARGPGIAAGRCAARIVDVCPTVLSLLGASGPPDLDGRVLTEILRAYPQASSAVPSGARSLGAVSPAEPEDTYTDADRRKIEDRLRRLGYLE